MTKTNHDTIIIHRRLDAPVSAVFAAWEDTDALGRWCCPGDDGWVSGVDAHAFEIGGRKQITFGPAGAVPYHEDTVYLDIERDKRIIGAETILHGDRRISTSLITLEFEPRGTGCDLMVRDQITLIDGAETADARRGGWGEVLDKLEADLRRGMASAKSA